MSCNTSCTEPSAAVNRLWTRSRVMTGATRVTYSRDSIALCSICFFLSLTAVMVFYGWTATSFGSTADANFVVHCFFQSIGACAIPRLTEISILDVISSTNALSSVMS